MKMEYTGSKAVRNGAAETGIPAYGGACAEARAAGMPGGAAGMPACAETCAPAGAAACAETGAPAGATACAETCAPAGATACAETCAPAGATACAETDAPASSEAGRIAASCGLCGLFSETCQRLSGRRLCHVKGVAATAYAYALKYGADVCKAVAAALYHDWFRDAGTDRLDALIEAYGLDARLKGNPDLSHSKIAAAYMENELGIDDSELLDAVRFHTTGRPAMSLLEKVIYIADATEPSRVFPAVSRLRELAWEDLDKACVFALENTIRYVEERGGRLDTDTLEALGWLNAAAGATCKKERGFDVAEQ